MHKKICKIILFLIILFFPGLLSAHPLGITEPGFRTVVFIFPDNIVCDYIVEVPTVILLTELDKFRDRNEFDRHMIGEIKRNLHLYVDGRRTGWIDFPGFQPQVKEGDINFFEYRVKLVAPFPYTASKKEVRVDVKNELFADMRAVYLNGVVGEKGVKILNAELASEKGWSSDHQNRNIEVTYEIDPSIRERELIGNVFDASDSNRGGSEGGRLYDLLHAKNLSASVVLIALFTAALFGALHAMAPGHGKALASAYLIGSKGDYFHAVMLGLVVTLTHTGAIILLGCLFYAFSSEFSMEGSAPVIGLISGIIIVIIGATMLYKRLFRDNHGHHHPEKVSTKSLIALGISGGIVPCPSALALMLVAISIERVIWGIVLVCAFSAGLALVLSMLGIIAVGAKNIFNKIPSSGGFLNILPIISSAVVIIIGFVIIISNLDIY